MYMDEKVLDKIHQLVGAKIIEDLPGDGQATCNRCGNISWCCFLYVYKGKVYCYRCLQEVIRNEYNL